MKEEWMGNSQIFAYGKMVCYLKMETNTLQNMDQGSLSTFCINTVGLYTDQYKS